MNLEDLQTPIAAHALEGAREVFCHWLGENYDTQVLDLMLATLAAEQLDGDPLWTLVLSGSGNAKTETVCAARGVGAIMVSTIASEGALLSASGRKNRGPDATGGLLRQIGERGVLIIKDVTSLLSADRTLRAQIIAALREIHDGRWDRPVGIDGARTLTWEGRIAVIGAATTAWDRAHDVVSSMGDRFVLIRADSTRHRVAAGRQAIGNTGSETRMRAELSEAVAGVVAAMDRNPIQVTEAETGSLLAAADLVTLARTGVEYDYRGDVTDSHAPEMPTRFAKQLAQVVRGGVAIGMPRAEATGLAIRAARDSMPPMRLSIIDDLAEHGSVTTQDVRRRIGKPRSTVDRQLQALHMLGVVAVDEQSTLGGGTRWWYSLADGINPEALRP